MGAVLVLNDLFAVHAEVFNQLLWRSVSFVPLWPQLTSLQVTERALLDLQRQHRLLVVLLVLVHIIYVHVRSANSVLPVLTKSHGHATGATKALLSAHIAEAHARLASLAEALLPRHSSLEGHAVPS